MAATHDRAPRWSQLLQLLAERGRLSVAEVCGELGVSEATVRRDFNELAAQQLATRTHGGVLATAVAYDLPARYKSASQDGAKQQIAVAAADLVQPGTVVGLNGGTTTSAVARQLASRPEIAASGLRPAVTVVTNALNIATEMVLRPAVRCIGLGGVARSESYEQTGPIAIGAMSQLWLDLLVIGVDGLTATTGATCRHDDEASINAAMVDRAERVVVVSTGDKIGRTTFARICESGAIDTLITDPTAPPAALAALREAGVHVTTVGDGHP
jgi:DeoR family transcriptional regulator, aga operon transcriptional repressor